VSFVRDLVYGSVIITRTNEVQILACCVLPVKMSRR